MAVLLEPILNQILQAEMTEHLKAKPGEQTDDRRGYRNGTYERKPTSALRALEDGFYDGPGPEAPVRAAWRFRAEGGVSSSPVVAS
jgi:hypothetical protein